MATKKSGRKVTKKGGSKKKAAKRTVKRGKK